MSAPLAAELVNDENDKKIFELLGYPQEMGRPFVAPPGVPTDRLQALRTAFEETMKDPDFLAEFEKDHPGRRADERRGGCSIAATGLRDAERDHRRYVALTAAESR